MRCLSWIIQDGKKNSTSIFFKQASLDFSQMDILRDPIFLGSTSGFMHLSVSQCWKITRKIADIAVKAHIDPHPFSVLFMQCSGGESMHGAIW